MNRIPHELVVTLLLLALAMPAASQVVADDQPQTANSPQPAADPDADLQEALARGDRRFVGLAGPTLLVLGVEDYAERYQDSYGVRLLAVKEESPADSGGVLANLAAYRYALRYNQQLLAIIRSE